PPTFDDYDSENVDPTQLSSPAKKTRGKSDAFAFSTSMPPPPTLPSRITTTPARANISSLRTPMTAPAGRSPKRKIAGLSRNRRTSAPFTRIDPPFATRGASLPFSLDAALSGTFSTPTAKPSIATTIQESMPKTWFFDVYEDTPEEESANLMEHSTLTLDLSSDDEGSRKVRDDRGKENCPPEGYEAGVASSRAVGGVVVEGGVVEGSVSVSASRYKKRDEVVRKKIFKDEMDDGERSPLSDLETEPFIPEGLDKDSHVVVDLLPTPEKAAAPASSAAKLDIATLFAAPASRTASSLQKTKSTSFLDLPIVTEPNDTKANIVVWEDSSSSVPERASTPVEQNTTTKGKGKKIEVYDENTAPLLDARL
ncbi:hypothetical protein B0A55_12868, partial [Friedmanniomyces simplex]